MKARLGTAAAPLAGLMVVLAGCSAGGDTEDRSRFEALEQEALDVVDGVLHDIAGETDMAFEAGTRATSICGESYAPRGVKLRVFARFAAPAEMATDDAMAATGEALTGDGWELDPQPRERIVLATREDLEIRFDFAGVVQVHITAGCIETSDGVAREIGDRPTKDLDWADG
ncbi:hypothetical protein [Nocardioides sp. Root190]|uniref:hypothetical protein n=1 Tax=Nocardioides sp. Root190 TaxID=1736488 RepID=UPI0012F741A5|nr:hypothetical protein [Nocardioides sp. Root190]